MTGEMSLKTLDNIVVYRYEMIFCCYNILARLYLLWYPIKWYMLRDIPNIQNVAAFANINFDSLFVLKRMVNSWNAGAYLAISTCLFMLLFGYLYRCCEVTACVFSSTRHKDCLLPSAQQ